MPTPMREAAKAQLEESNPDFNVVACSWDESSETTTYIVSIPFAITRRGIFRYFDLESKLTAFGYELNQIFNTRGIEESSINAYTIRIIVKPGGPTEQFAGLRWTTMGMPAEICIELQAAILRNRGPIQRLAQFLRGIF